MSYTQEQIDRANAVSLEDFLRSQGESLKRCGKDMEWKAHDSLKVRGNKWHRFSNDTGGYPIDFVMEFYGKSFPEAVEMLIGEKGEGQPGAVPTPSPEFHLPLRNVTNANARKYLVTERGIDEGLVDLFMNTGDIYEDADHHNVVFVGRDPKNLPRYAHCRGTRDKFRLDVKGSDKAYGFSHQGKGDKVCVFEAPIDLLSFINLFPKDWQDHSYLSLGGVAYKALQQFMEDHKDIRTIYLCLDNDEAGEAACIHLNKEIPLDKSVYRMKPPVKDWNELLLQKEQFDRKDWYVLQNLREKNDAGEFVPMIRMSDVEQTEVAFLWKPYIPFGKLTILHGDAGNGKTYLAMQLCAACTNRSELPHMEVHEPFKVIYQTAEDGLGDTIKPRLIEAGADLEKVLVIDEGDDDPLTLADERIEKAIRQNDARLLIIDPIQAFLGPNVDMNRANEVRPILRKIGDVAQRTGCAIVLIGHLNKATGQQSGYRGLGSIDFTAGVRSVLVIGKSKDDPNVRVLAHDKSSLAPAGTSLAFILGDEEGFRWIGDFDISAEELLSGFEKKKESKTHEAKELICRMLAGGKEAFSDEIDRAALEKGISSRTVRDAKKELGEALKSKIGEGRRKVFWME
ncbi:AAA family ATPase [Anaerolactibacter massiliensis]|uniref:AAA family ATPase n=1 Tax=Anaerolactibacter massiliensis TaxID=2044573 RepID=UPI000CF925B9|nr:AAA family ATPase [Anaerolactibacter massiliensis]